ncbi:MAG: serine hydrolase [Syntrophobacteraceae bacterium]
MQRKQHLVCGLVLFFGVFLLPQGPHAKINQRINAKSAILIDMDSGCVLFEQNADSPIPPASITKILSLYLVFEAIKEGQVHLWDKVEVSRRAAATGGSRMGLKAGARVPLEELIKGMAVVSGNDACVAAAEHISGNVERFVRKMNAKARDLGMRNTRFMTPNGLPASGQMTTARDISRLSIAYLRRFPESLTIHSMQAYSYGKSSHHNANRLLGKCPGVDGLKTGFVCASGYNISATAKRGGTRVLAVVMGARTPWIRLAETEKLLEAGFRECGQPNSYSRYASAGGEGGGVRAASGPGNGAKARAVCKLQQKQVRAKLARTAGASKKSTHAKVSLKAGKGKAAGAKSVAGKKGKGRAAVASAKSKSGRKIAGAGRAGAKSTQAKAGKSTRSAKAQKVAKSSSKKQTKTLSTRKKSPGKAAPHANAVKKKAKG